MAILFGTTADGETLPVEVNEFGQLIAEGLNGPPGPPGPPGIGQLPPDPFEGAILGWKDDTLSWLGAPAPLPANTYGPIVSYSDGVLVLENSVSLPYLTSIYLSDNEGAVAIWSPFTAPITSINPSGTVGPFTFAFSSVDGLGDFSVGDLVQGDVDESAVWSDQTSLSSGTYDGGKSPLNFFGSYPRTAAMQPNNYDAIISLDLDFVVPVGGVVVTYLHPHSILELLYQGEVKEVIDSGPAATSCTNQTYAGPIDKIKMSQSTTSDVFVTDIRVNGLALVNTGVPNNNAYVTNVDATSMTVSAGTWYLGSRVFGPEKSGLGTVQTTVNNTIVLRENNDEWKAGFYVTAPDQMLAARLVRANELRK